MPRLLTRRSILAILLLGIWWLVCPSAATPTYAQSSASESRPAVLTTYCITCHNQRLKSGGLTLDLVDVGHPERAAELWEKVVRKLRSGTMPPAGRPRPAPALLDAFVTSIEAALDRAAAETPNPGRPAIHRLNRSEYTNAIRDLLAIDVDKTLLPADDSAHGFDNIADALNVSSGLLERYLAAAMTVSRLAIPDPAARPGVTTYSLPAPALRQHDRMNEELPFGSRGGLAVRHHFPLDGDYLIRIHPERHDLSVGNNVKGLDQENHIDIRIDGERVKMFPIGGLAAAALRSREGAPVDEDRADAGLEVRVRVRAGTRTVGVTFQQRRWYYEGIVPAEMPVASTAANRYTTTNRESGKIEAAIASVDITGPFDGRVSDETAAYRRIFVCQPQNRAGEEPCAKRILSAVARRAYRRPVTDDEISTLLGFYRSGREGGFRGGIREAIERLLVDPSFLFRAERTPSGVARGAVHRISQLELASRLSFFLWSSIPDDELLGLAERGALVDSATLERQIRRMLADRRSKAFVESFFGQWLYLRNLTAVKPDPVAFPEFDENLRHAFQEETALFLESLIRDDRGALDLLTADYTFVNERLARHYGIPNVYGSHFRRVTLPQGARAGILGQGAVLMVTSYPNRTSPVLRGKWLLENLLGVPPPPPPPDVPTLEEAPAGQPASMRERMEQHRKNPVCANCHTMIDPLGFGLENFDGVGKWRVADNGVPVDASGALPDGTTFTDPRTFRAALVGKRDALLTTLTEKLLTYALGRGVEHFDMPAIRGIVRGAAGHGDRWSALILGIATSTPFQMRTAP